MLIHKIGQSKGMPDFCFDDSPQKRRQLVKKQTVLGIFRQANPAASAAALINLKFAVFAFQIVFRGVLI
ncbi:MAG TPA: hypothetical protein DDX91_02470 [Ruminococcaceae bacterium]|nr:hypothetical protein [Oscillospiraceae bacterium]